MENSRGEGMRETINKKHKQATAAASNLKPFVLLLKSLLSVCGPEPFEWRMERPPNLQYENK